MDTGPPPSFTIIYFHDYLLVGRSYLLSPRVRFLISLFACTATSIAFAFHMLYFFFISLSSPRDVLHCLLIYRSARLRVLYTIQCPCSRTSDLDFGTSG